MGSTTTTTTTMSTHVPRPVCPSMCSTTTTTTSTTSTMPSCLRCPVRPIMPTSMLPTEETLRHRQHQTSTTHAYTLVLLGFLYYTSRTWKRISCTNLVLYKLVR